MAEKDEKKTLTTLDIAIIVISFLGFVGTLVNVAFAIQDHITLKNLHKRVMRS